MEIAIESGWQSPSPLPSPTVDVVLIVRDLKPWFEEVLSGLATQDYRNFKIFVINAAEESKREAIALKVFSQLPSAQIVNYSGFSTFSEAVNSVTEHKDFDSYGHFYLLLHEDLVLNATALRRMAEAALDANAGIVGLKVLSGEDPNHLEDMGTSIDRLGSPVPVVELGEIDQGQHDFQQNFFAVSEAAMLIRVDLFVALGGFDLSIREPDSHVDLCWRARLVGAATLLVPKAVGYRFRNSSLREIASSSHNLRPRQRLRMMLTNTSGFKTFTVLFESVFVTVLGVLYGFLTGRFRLVWGHISAWVWNIWKLKEIRINRSRIARLTEGRSIFSLSDTWLPHHALRRAITGRAPRGSRAEAPARIRFHQLLGALLGSGGILLLTCGGVIGFGSRHLLAQGLPAVGRFQMFPSDPLDLFRSWWHGWRSTGMGVDIPGPDGLSLLGLFAALVPGSDQLILTLVVLAAFPVGAIGLWLLVRPIGGGRSRAVAVVVYLAFPLPYDALREGRLTPLIGYALIPWLARYLVSAQGGFSFGSVNGHSRTTVLQSSLLGNALMVGLLIAIGVAFDPIVVVPILTVFAGLVLGNAMTGNLIGLKRLSLVALGGFIVALLIHLPLAVQILNSGSITFLFEPNVWPVGDLGTSGIFNLDTGSFRNDAFGWVFFVVPMMVFFVTARRHLVLGICAWFVIAAGLCGVWMFDQGWWTGRIPNPETLFLPVILGLAWATAVSVAAIGEDLSTRVAIWRRLLIPVAGLALIVNVTPVLLSSFEGSWGAPKKGLFEAVNFIFD